LEVQDITSMWGRDDSLKQFQGRHTKDAMDTIDFDDSSDSQDDGMIIPGENSLKHIFSEMDQNDAGFLHDEYLLNCLYAVDRKHDRTLPKKKMLQEWMKTYSGLVSEDDFIEMMHVIDDERVNQVLFQATLMDFTMLIKPDNPIQDEELVKRRNGTKLELEKGMSEKEVYKHRIIEIWKVHNPSKIPEIEDLLRRYKKKEYDLYTRVCKKYNEDVLPKPSKTPRRKVSTTPLSKRALHELYSNLFQAKKKKSVETEYMLTCIVHVAEKLDCIIPNKNELWNKSSRLEKCTEDNFIKRFLQCDDPRFIVFVKKANKTSPKKLKKMLPKIDPPSNRSSKTPSQRGSKTPSERSAKNLQLEKKRSSSKPSKSPLPGPAQNPGYKVHHRGPSKQEFFVFREAAKRLVSDLERCGSAGYMLLSKEFPELSTGLEALRPPTIQGMQALFTKEDGSFNTDVMQKCSTILKYQFDDSSSSENEDEDDQFARNPRNRPETLELDSDIFPITPLRYDKINQGSPPRIEDLSGSEDSLPVKRSSAFRFPRSGSISSVHTSDIDERLLGYHIDDEELEEEEEENMSVKNIGELSSAPSQNLDIQTMNTYLSHTSTIMSSGTLHMSEDVVDRELLERERAKNNQYEKDLEKRNKELILMEGVMRRIAPEVTDKVFTIVRLLEDEEIELERTDTSGINQDEFGLIASVFDDDVSEEQLSTVFADNGLMPFMEVVSIVASKAAAVIKSGPEALIQSQNEVKALQEHVETMTEEIDALLGHTPGPAFSISPKIDPPIVELTAQVSDVVTYLRWETADGKIYEQGDYDDQNKSRTGHLEMGEYFTGIAVYDEPGNALERSFEKRDPLKKSSFGAGYILSTSFDREVPLNVSEGDPEPDRTFEAKEGYGISGLLFDDHGRLEDIRQTRMWLSEGTFSYFNEAQAYASRFSDAERIVKLSVTCTNKYVVSLELETADGAYDEIIFDDTVDVENAEFEDSNKENAVQTKEEELDIVDCIVKITQSTYRGKVVGVEFDTFENEYISFKSQLFDRRDDVKTFSVRDERNMITGVLKENGVITGIEEGYFLTEETFQHVVQELQKTKTSVRTKSILATGIHHNNTKLMRVVGEYDMRVVRHIRGGKRPGSALEFGYDHDDDEPVLVKQPKSKFRQDPLEEFRLRDGEYLVAIEYIPNCAIKLRTSMGKDITMCGDDFESGIDEAILVEAEPGRSISTIDFSNVEDPKIKESILIPTLVNVAIEKKEHELNSERIKLERALEEISSLEREIDPAATLKLFRIAPSEWNVNDVSAFLSAVGLHVIRDELFDRNVDGPQFIDLTDADLTKFEESKKHLLLNAVKVISKVDDSFEEHMSLERNKQEESERHLAEERKLKRQVHESTQLEQAEVKAWSMNLSTMRNFLKETLEDVNALEHRRSRSKRSETLSKTLVEVRQEFDQLMRDGLPRVQALVEELRNELRMTEDRMQRDRKMSIEKVEEGFELVEQLREEVHKKTRKILLLESDLKQAQASQEEDEPTWKRQFEEEMRRKMEIEFEKANALRDIQSDTQGANHWKQKFEQSERNFSKLKKEFAEIQRMKVSDDTPEKLNRIRQQTEQQVEKRIDDLKGQFEDQIRHERRKHKKATSTVTRHCVQQMCWTQVLTQQKDEEIESLAQKLDACEEALRELDTASKDYQEHSIGSQADEIDTLRKELEEITQKYINEQQLTAELGTRLKNGTLHKNRVSPSSAEVEVTRSTFHFPDSRDRKGSRGRPSSIKIKSSTFCFPVPPANKDKRWTSRNGGGNNNRYYEKQQQKIIELEEMRDQRDRDMKNWQQEVFRLTNQTRNLEQENIELRGLVQKTFKRTPGVRDETKVLKSKEKWKRRALEYMHKLGEKEKHLEAGFKELRQLRTHVQELEARAFELAEHMRQEHISRVSILKDNIKLLAQKLKKQKLLHERHLSRSTSMNILEQLPEPIYLKKMDESSYRILLSSPRGSDYPL